MKRKFAVALAAAAIFTMIPMQAQAQAGKVSITSSDLQMQLGDSTDVTLALDAPIICAGSAPSCDVTLDFTSAFASGITVTPAIVTWQANEWSQTRTISVTVDAAAELYGAQTSTASVVSNSEYYSAFVPALTVTLPDAPTPAPVMYDAAPGSGLANTGSNDLIYAVVGFSLVASGGALSLKRRRQSR